MSMSWIQNIAPILGQALLGPLGGAAAGFLADKLGVPDKTVEAVTEALNSGKLSADQVASIKAAEIEFQKFLKQNNIDLYALEVKDRDGARAMMAATKSLTPSILTGGITIGFFGVLLGLMYGNVEKTDALMIMLGSLGTAWTAAVSYWFGSSHGSAQKSEMLAKSTPAS